MMINHGISIKRKFLTSVFAAAHKLAYGHQYDDFRPTALSIATATLKFKGKCLPKNFQTEPLGWKGPLVNSRFRLGCSRLFV